MAHLTDLGFTLLELGKAVDDGEVRVQTHPEFPNLNIANYTEEVQFRNRWNKITLACRGLIFDELTGEVIARPWEKFFNFGQMDNRIDSTAPVEVTDKKDGSLGILYRRPDAKWAIATRGSFVSDQAIHATELLNREYIPYFDHFLSRQNGLVPRINRLYTFLFEIVYPSNRIVVNYGKMDDLILLGAVHKELGYYLGPGEAKSILDWLGPVTETFDYPDFISALSAPDRKGMEGVVIRSGNKMVKLKQADYVELHRIVTNLSPKTIWEMIGSGKTISDICAEIPDEFHEYVEAQGRKMLDAASEIKYNATIDFNRCVTAAGGTQSAETNRREFARFATQEKHSSLLFLMLDGKPIDDVVWRMVRPRGDIKSLVEDNG